MKFLERSKRQTEREESVVKQNAIVFENKNTLYHNTTVNTDKNAMMIGPLTVNDGVTITIKGTLTIS